MTHLGLIGLGTMGENLVRNLVSHGESIVVWNRTLEKVEALASELGNSVTKANSIAELVKAIEPPRNIILLVPAGKVTDEVAHELLGILSPGDAIWDLGNAHWDTTINHQKMALEHGIHWVGCGISGGSEWARLGPALMPGGERSVIEWMLPILEKIAAKDFGGNPCVTYVWSGPAGNFVKMVHNGIEYAIMQGIAEIYDILRASWMEQSKIRETFQEINSGVLKSFLLDITVEILGTKDPIDGQDLLPKISDAAGSKWTGGWTVEAALKLGIPVPNIAEALFARWMSGRKYTFSPMKNDGEITPLSRGDGHRPGGFHEVLILTYLSSYLQWLELILAAEKEYQWWIKLSEVLRIWQGGCIIRSRMLEVLPALYNLPISANTQDLLGNIRECMIATKSVLQSTAAPTPVISSALNYFTTIQSETLPTNLIQAMRDSFGAHGVKRTGSEVSENFLWK